MRSYMKMLFFVLQSKGVFRSDDTRGEDNGRKICDINLSGCGKMADEAMKIIPGGVQHNLAFNHPFPLAVSKADDACLCDVDGNRYYDFLQAGGPAVLGGNPETVRNKVIELLNICGPSTGAFSRIRI